MFALNRKKPNKGTNMFSNTFSNIINNTNSSIIEQPKTTILPTNSIPFSTIPEYFEPLIFDATKNQEYETLYNSLNATGYIDDVMPETIPEVISETIPEVISENHMCDTNEPIVYHEEVIENIVPSLVNSRTPVLRKTRETIKINNIKINNIIIH